MLTICFADTSDDIKRQPNVPEDWSLTTASSPQESLSLDSSTLALPGHALMSTDGLSLDSQQLATRSRVQCSAVNCQNSAALASLKCLNCRRVYCPSCAPLSLSCRKNPSGHRFVSSLLRTRSQPARKPKRNEGPPWECKHCTMINGPQVLVCLGCDTLREVEAQEGRNVCPMCTLVNEPGKTKCELCNTDLVSQQAATVADESSDSPI